MKKSILFCFTTILVFSLLGCSKPQSHSEAQSPSKEKVASASSEIKEVSIKNEEIHISPYVSERVVYTNDRASIWVKQFLFIKGGDASGELVKSLNDSKTSVILYYEKNNIIKEIDLTALALKYNLYGGVQRICTSATCKYIAVEFGCLEQNSTLLIDTTTNTARMLWYNEKENNSMISVSWKDNSDETFAFIPSVGNEVDLLICNLNDNSIKKVGTIQAKAQITTSYIIKWSNDGFNVLDMMGQKVYKVLNK